MAKMGIFNILLCLVVPAVLVFCWLPKGVLSQTIVIAESTPEASNLPDPKIKSDTESSVEEKKLTPFHKDPAFYLGKALHLLTIPSMMALNQLCKEFGMNKVHLVTALIVAAMQVPLLLTEFFSYAKSTKDFKSKYICALALSQMVAQLMGITAGVMYDSSLVGTLSSTSVALIGTAATRLIAQYSKPKSDDTVESTEAPTEAPAALDVDEIKGDDAQGESVPKTTRM